MSSGPTRTKAFNGNTYYRLKLTKEDWCMFKDCPIEFNVILTGDDYCWVCKYHKKLDIPKLLDERGK
jgi:hypothetical protein